MPIKPENKNRYPKDWKQIRASILFRANNSCEFCGLKNGLIISRNEQGYVKDLWNGDVWKTGEDGWLVPAHNVSWRLSEWNSDHMAKIVLTIAHLDHQPENNNPENLKALCQKCHLSYDKDHHAKTRRETKLKTQPQLF